MNWLMNLGTRAKLLLGFGLIILFLIYVITSAYTTITNIQTSGKNLFEREFTNAVDLKDIRSNQNAIRANLATMLVISSQSELKALEQDINTRSQENTDRLAALLDRNRDNAVFLAKLKEFNAVRIAWRENWENQIIPMIHEGKTEDAKTLILGVQGEHQQKLREIADELVGIAEMSAQTAVKDSAQLAVDSIRTFGAGGAIIILISAITAILLIQVIRKVGWEIREGANVLATAAGEIVATTTQIASGAAETATAVTETTSTVEEVKKTAELTSDKARYVSETAQKAAQISQTGKRSVDQSIEGINQVRQQMEAIAGSIMKLSEQSQAIGEIIATVNDLAEQSNLLAVNAAIEATTAGEQGKRFGVVAQEIKSLAEQSKQATAQVRAILGEIQKATTAAVLVAEQGSKAVEAGVKQSTETGEAIRQLAQSITEAAQAVTQIAASSQQQQAGMDQVALAMENINQASTQNVAGTKQAETAAHNLNELGQKLKGIVEQYKL